MTHEIDSQTWLRQYALSGGPKGCSHEMEDKLKAAADRIKELEAEVAAIDALEQAGIHLQGVIDGSHQIVPKEPTGAMMLNVIKQSDERYGGKYSAYGPLQWHYKAMLEAAKTEKEG